MTVSGRGLVFQPVLVTQTCTYNSNNIITLQNIDITDFPSPPPPQEKKLKNIPPPKKPTQKNKKQTNNPPPQKKKHTHTHKKKNTLTKEATIQANVCH